MRHSNNIMIREFVRLLREGTGIPQVDAAIEQFKANPKRWAFAKDSFEAWAGGARDEDRAELYPNWQDSFFGFVYDAMEGTGSPAQEPSPRSAPAEERSTKPVLTGIPKVDAAIEEFTADPESWDEVRENFYTWASGVMDDTRDDDYPGWQDINFQQVLDAMGAPPREAPEAPPEEDPVPAKAARAPRASKGPKRPSPKSVGVPREGKNFLRAEDMTELFSDISQAGSEAEMKSIIAQAMKVSPAQTDEESVARSGALKRVYDDLTRINQFSGIDFSRADLADPTVIEVLGNKSAILNRLADSLPKTGFFKADSYTDPLEVEKALVQAGVIGAGADLQTLAMLSANKLGDMVFRTLAGTARGRKAIRDVNDPSFLADMKTELDALADVVEAGPDLKFSRTKSSSTLYVSTGKKNYNVEVPKVPAFESLSDPDAIPNFLAMVARDLRDTQARFDIAKKPAVKPTKADFAKPLSPEEEVEQDPVGVATEAIPTESEISTSNDLSMIKNQLGKWVEENTKTGKKTGKMLRNEFDRAIKGEDIFEIVEETLYKMSMSPDLDEDQKVKLVALTAAWTTDDISPANKVTITLNVLSMLGFLVDRDQIRIMQALGDAEEELRDVGGDFAEGAIEEIDAELAKKLESAIFDAVESEDVKDSIFDVLVASDRMKSQMQSPISGIEDDELIEALEGLGIKTVEEALLALKERGPYSKEELRARKKVVRDALLEVGRRKGIPAPAASVNDLANAITSGPKLAGFIRSMNVFFDAGLTPEVLESMVTKPDFRETSEMRIGIKILGMLSKSPNLDSKEKKVVAKAIQNLNADLTAAITEYEMARQKKKGR